MGKHVLERSPRVLTGQSLREEIIHGFNQPSQQKLGIEMGLYQQHTANLNPRARWDEI